MIAVYTIFQLIDLQAIAKLKAFHYGNAGKEEEAKEAEAQAERFRVEGDRILVAVAAGEMDLPMHKHLRWHDHGKVEGQGDKLKEAKESVMGIAGDLATIHAAYWESQTAIQSIKGALDRARRVGDLSEMRKLNGEFVEYQRNIDMCNQRRNELVQIGDEALAKVISVNTKSALNGLLGE